MAKRMAFTAHSLAGKLLLGHRQFGAGIPGGLDVVVAFRLTAERVLSGREQRTAVVDIDLKNAFPSFEWAAIRGVCATHTSQLCRHGLVGAMRRLLVSTCLQAGRCVSIVASNKVILWEVCWSAQLSWRPWKARADLDREVILFFDVWYLDGGQLFRAVSAILRALDARFAAVGATRGSGSAVKSVVRVLGTAAVQEARAWATPCVRDTCVTPFDDALHLLHVLGVDTDSRAGSFGTVVRFAARSQESTSASWI